jgi:hypothetical protein
MKSRNYKYCFKFSKYYNSIVEYRPKADGEIVDLAFKITDATRLYPSDSLITGAGIAVSIKYISFFTSATMFS